MPAMTMVFQVRDAALLDKVKAGDKVSFNAEKIPGGYAVTPSRWPNESADAVATLALPIAAHAELVEIKWTGDAFAHKASIAPKQFLEVCGKLKSGDRTTWQFKGSGPSDFNIHYHLGKDVTYPSSARMSAGARRHAGRAARSGLLLDVEQPVCAADRYRDQSQAGWHREIACLSPTQAGLAPGIGCNPAAVLASLLWQRAKTL